MLNWKDLTDIGVHDDMPFNEKSKIRISNQAMLITSAISMIYLLYEIFFLPVREDPMQKFWFYALHSIVVLATVIIIYMNKRGRAFEAKITILIILTISVLGNSLTLKQPFRSEMYFFVLAPFAFIIFSDIKIILFFFILQALCFTVIASEVVDAHPSITTSGNGLYIRIFFLFTVLFFVLYFLKYETIRYQHEIEIKNSLLSTEHDHLEKQNFTKDKIFSIISHDLKSPINSLKALLQLLNQDHLTEQEFRKATTGLERQVFQLSNSLEELLVWSKAQLHGINPNPVLFEVKKVVAQIATINKMTARNKKIIITTNIPTGTVVYCDENMFRSVITNLLSNAVKFTPEGGAISIEAAQKENGVFIKVEDTGIGIPEENMKKILSPSDHFTTAGTNNEKGTGLGLVMCHEFIVRNNGSLKVSSTPGKGSVFLIDLPSNPEHSKPSVKEEIVKIVHR